MSAKFFLTLTDDKGIEVLLNVDAVAAFVKGDEVTQEWTIIHLIGGQSLRISKPLDWFYQELKQALGA